MKRFILMFSMLFVFLFAPALAVMAAAAGDEVLTEQGVEAYFYSVAALAGAALAVTEIVKKLIGSSGSWTKYLSWVISVVLAFVGWWLGLGIFSGITVIWVVAYGIAAGLIANSVFDSVVVEMILKLFKKKVG